MDHAEIKKWIESEEYKLFCEGSDLEERGAYDAAARTYLKAANLGSAICMSNLANILDDHASVKDPEAAVYWYKRAIRCGYEIAAYNLALHHKNRGNKRWHAYWLEWAADMGDEDATEDLAALA